jgi:hypothetical protein
LISAVASLHSERPSAPRAAFRAQRDQLIARASAPTLVVRPVTQLAATGAAVSGALLSV